uniref:Uncharacterized protein n=1 Tax=Zooxanthella nutricula TaxID=1333877 RepID=A0A7S2NXE7_9DINO|mmetsp:Transcript_41444/g.125220  ORF Transcript_41444/g.125220 Transcript_41444/m.125220 type:complete len:188 (+) Transcript_41444:160-723(+)
MARTQDAHSLTALEEEASVPGGGQGNAQTEFKLTDTVDTLSESEEDDVPAETKVNAPPKYKGPPKGKIGSTQEGTGHVPTEPRVDIAEHSQKDSESDSDSEDEHNIWEQDVSYEERVAQVPLHYQHVIAQHEGTYGQRAAQRQKKIERRAALRQKKIERLKEEEHACTGCGIFELVLRSIFRDWWAV